MIQKGSRVDHKPITVIRNGTSAYEHHSDFTMNFDWYLNIPGVIGNEFVVSLVVPTMMREDQVIDGFEQVNSALVVDRKNGKGLQSLWQACLQLLDRLLGDGY